MDIARVISSQYGLSARATSVIDAGAGKVQLKRKGNVLHIRIGELCDLFACDGKDVGATVAQQRLYRYPATTAEILPILVPPPCSRHLWPRQTWSRFVRLCCFQLCHVSIQLSMYDAGHRVHYAEVSSGERPGVNRRHARCKRRNPRSGLRYMSMSPNLARDRNSTSAYHRALLGAASSISDALALCFMSRSPPLSLSNRSK